MKKSTEFHDYVMHDVLGHISGITSRSMFSGYGLYLNGMIFGIIAEGALYFKVDVNNRAEYENLGSKPFTYEGKGGKRISLSYYEVPEEVMDNRARIIEWVMQSAEINAAKKKSSKK